METTLKETSEALGICMHSAPAAENLVTNKDVLYLLYNNVQIARRI